MAKSSRPPVITIMGHVDHGKTTLLDYIRNAKVAAGEAGGITQHIGAYSIDFKGKALTFIDTPGHAAFNRMRERGSQITDLVILVVAANDGVKPQTIESIRHIKSAKVPVLVAINKIDLPDVNPEIAKSQLAEHELVVTDYGGDIETVEISAKTGKGVDTLLETIQVMAELLELEADPDAPLEAVIIESSKDKQRGSVANVIVQNGTLSIKQDVYAQDISGRIKQLSNELGEQLHDVLPGFPAQIIGFNGVPGVGTVVRDQKASYAAEAPQEPEAESDEIVGLDFAALLEDKPRLPLIVKADTEGTLEAILQNLDDDSTELLSSGLGQVTEGDLELAEASGATIITFHTTVPKKIIRLAKKAGVRVKSYDIIYELIEQLQKQMLKLIEPTIDEVVTGEAEIVQIFEMKGQTIAGSKVKTGEFKKNDLLHLKRNDEIIANPVIKSMMHGKEEISQVTAKSEFGVTFKNKKLDFQVGDILIAYKIQDED
ncbi:MAG: translation initiation factor IF-2 [Microgenomates group bacterium]